MECCTGCPGCAWCAWAAYLAPVLIMCAVLVQAVEIRLRKQPVGGWKPTSHA